MKKGAIVLAFLLLLSLASCVNKTDPPVTDTYTDKLPESFNADEKEFTAHYVKITPTDEALMDAYSKNVRWMRQSLDVPTKTKNSGLCGSDAEWSELEKITQSYNSEYFKTNHLFAFTVTVTSGSDRVALTRVTQDAADHIRFYVDIAEADGGTADFATWLVLAETEKLNVNNMAVFVNPAVKAPAQVIKNSDAGIELTLPEGWSYREIADSENKIGFDIGPQKYGGYGLEIYYNKQQIEGLCGTGLSYGTITLGKYSVSAYSYDEKYPFSFAYIGANGYELSNTNAGYWWDEYKEEIDRIFNSLVLKEE